LFLQTSRVALKKLDTHLATLELERDLRRLLLELARSNMLTGPGAEQHQRRNKRGGELR